MTCTTASAEINVDVLTHGGWESPDAQQCYFFNDDGSILVSGYTISSMKWESQPDGRLKVTDGGLNTWYISEIKVPVIYRSDGAKFYHKPFAEKEDEIARRKGNKYRDQTWEKPHSPNLLAAQLYDKYWINDKRDKCIIFYKTDTCLVTDLRQLIVNDKYLWQALDSANVRLTEVNAPHNVSYLNFKMLPDAFVLKDNDAEEQYIRNAYSDLECLSMVMDMVSISPVGCYDFFVRNAKSIDSFMRSTYSGREKTPEYAVFVGGRLWECDGISYPTGAYRKVSYVNHPDKHDTVERSFNAMTAILNQLWEPDLKCSDENNRIYNGDAPGNVALIITLSKTEDSVTLDIHTK